MDRLLKKLVAVLLVITLAGANLSILGMYGISYALSDKELSGQIAQTENSNVEFNAYFEGGEHTNIEEIESKTAKLYVNVKVKNAGYLKNGMIVFEDTNFKIGDIQNENIQSIDKENNKIVLKQLNNGSDVTLEIPISILNNEKIPADHFAKESKAKFSGMYIDGNGREKSVSKEIINKLSWEGEAEAQVTSEFTKFVPYATEGKYGVMLQAKINSGVVDCKLPIKNTQINVNVPQINGVKPTNVKAIAVHTKATTGDMDGLKFVDENYTYNMETGIFTIRVAADEANEIAWLKDVQDEYLVTFIFEGEEIYNEAKTNGVNSVSMNTNVSIEVYGNTNTQLTPVSVDTEITRTEKLGTIADFDIEVIDQISKGQIYANYDVIKKKEVSYFERYIATVNSKELTDTITFTQGLDKFLTKDNDEGPTTVSGNHYTYNKEIQVNVEVFTKMLGEEGSIDVYKTDKTKIGTINKETTVKDGNYVLDISNQNTNEIYMVASKPQTEGRLVVTIQKAMKTDIDYDKTQMKSFTKVEASLEGKASTSTVNAKSQFLLKEPTSVAKLSISKRDLTTVVKNEDVEIRAILDTSDIYNGLYKNPTLKITLPSYISKVNIKKHDIIMANGLKIKGTPQVVTENGKQVINITLEGVQEEYTIGAEYEGTMVVLNTDLTVKTLTPSGTNKITMKFTNANDMVTNNEGTVETSVNFVAPTGIVAANGISNYAEGKSDMMSISDKGVTGKIATYSEKRTATIYGKIVNNYENKIGNVVILGRLPVKDNQKIDTEESLGSNFNTTLKTNITLKGINSSKYTVYYSENVNATQDLTNANNGWSETATNNTKSYMIVTKDYEMGVGETIEFSYDIEIPANLKHNQNVSEVYKVYYNNISSIGRMAETKVSPIMTMTTGQGPELNVELKSTVDTVREGQIVKMKAVVKNTGTVTAKNVKVNIPLPEYGTFMEYHVKTPFITIENAEGEIQKELEAEIGILEPGESKEFSYYVKFDENTIKYASEEEWEDMTEEEKQEVLDSQNYPKRIVNQVAIVADQLSNAILSKECIMQLEEGNIAIELFNNKKENEVLKKDEQLEYMIYLRNISGKDTLKDTVVTIPLSENMTFDNAEIVDMITNEKSLEGISYDKVSHTVTVNVGTLDIIKAIVLNVKVKDTNGDFSMIATAKADEISEHYSNILESTVKKVDLEISELTATPKYVKEGEFVTYKLSITNNGEVSAQDVTILGEWPEELLFEQASYTYGGTNNIVARLNSEDKLEVVISNLLVGETTNITIQARAKLLNNKDDKQIQSKLTVSAQAFDVQTTNTVTNIIEYYENAHEDISGDNNSSQNRHKITGTAWLDSNKNGKRDTDEQLLANIPVILLNRENNKVVTDVDTKEVKRVTTRDNGTYEFTNLAPGDYIVIFLYDVAKYSLTAYQEKDVDISLNSDAIDINITIDGTRTIAGTTDIIKISDENVRDIDIGLYTSQKFDLRLDKYISKITRTTPSSGSTVYNYNNSKLAKIEVLGKNLGKSNIVIEYKIVVTNEGAIPGYAKKIVDYLPKGVGFSTELNKDWYLSDNGNVYNASLANELIQPGESKEVTLVLTKKITEDSLGDPINNNAEIYEASNEQGLKDFDSTPGNKSQDEDDMSKADIILSIVTGKIVMYTTITLGMIAILGFGIFEIKKRILDKKN